MNADLRDVADWCKRWHDARERYLEALKEPDPSSELQELRNWEDRYRIAFENAFQAYFGRFPAGEDCAGGMLGASNG